MEISKFYPTIHELTELFALMFDPSDIMSFHHFVHIYRKSECYKVPSGVIRIEPYPGLGAATVHGIFRSNPFYDIQLIKNMLNSYMEARPWLSWLECIVPRENKGLIKLAHKFSEDTLEGPKFITFYWR